MCNCLLINLIKKFKKHNMNVFTVIYDEFKDLILLYSARLGGEDTTQDLLIFLIELLYGIELSRFGYDQSDTLTRYIRVSLKNKYISLSKENQRYKTLSEAFEDCSYLFHTNDEYFGISEALKLLSKKQQLIITYKYIHNYSDAEISEMLDISRQAVNRLKNRALTILKEFYNCR